MLYICKTCLRNVLKLSSRYGFDTSVRTATTWKRRMIKQDELKGTVNQYASKNTNAADRVYVWGYAGTGALGIKSFLKPKNKLPPRKQQLAPHRVDFWPEYKIKVLKAACGYGFSVYLCNTDSGHRVYGSGINTDSQIGYQEFPKHSGRILDYVIEPVIVELPLNKPESTKLLDVSCGRAHTVILTDTEGIFSLGHNAYGQCGRPAVVDEIYRGSQKVNKLLFDEHVEKVICGQDHTLFLTEAGEVFTCGLGADGQTGLGHYSAVGEPTKVEGDIKGEKIVHISSKADCVLAVSDSGEVFGWGNSEYGQLSAADPSAMQINRASHLPLAGVGRVMKVCAAGSMCALLNESGQVYVWGYGILGKGPKLEQSTQPQLIPESLFGRNEFNPDQRVVDIECGLTHLAAVTATGDLFTWGRNKSACLGLGDNLDQFFPFKVQVPASVKQIVCGVDHTVAVCKAFS